MELETINKLYLELSQITTATTAREILLRSQLIEARRDSARLKNDDVGEPVAWCIPNDPCNATAFAWPGTDRTPQHNVPLFTADQLAAAADAEREKCAGIVNELRMECARRNMPESATMLWHAEDAIRAGAKEASDG